MQATEATRVNSIAADLEELWGHWDTIIDRLTPEDWNRKHGKHWTVADVPYHLGYFDREIAIRPIRYGPDFPESERSALYSMGELTAWNVAMFARRPAGQTAQQSVVEMKAIRDDLRRIMHGMSDEGLDQPAWMPLVLFTGWRTVGMALESVRIHTWNHLLQLCAVLKSDLPNTSDRITHTCLGFYVGMMGEHFLNKAEAANGPFTAVLAFTGGGGGAWTIRVQDGSSGVHEGEADNPDLVMTQSPQHFVMMMNGMVNPLLSLLTGRMKVRGFSKMGRFGKLFAEPKPNDHIEPAPGTSL